MASLREMLQNPHYRALYSFEHLEKPAINRNHLGHQAYDDGSFGPIFIDANPGFYVQMKRPHAHSKYNVGLHHSTPDLNAEVKVKTALSNDPYRSIYSTLQTLPPENPYYGHVRRYKYPPMFVGQ